MVSERPSSLVIRQRSIFQNTSILLLALISGCGSSRARSVSGAEIAAPFAERAGMKVTVENSGKELANFEEPLVHRIEVGSAATSAGLKAGREFDGAGKERGIRVRKESTAETLALLGLKSEDVITAIGRRRVTTPEDLQLLDSELRSGGSLTLERGGNPHKIYFTPRK